MAEADPLRKYVEAGIAFTQLTKARAEAIVRELVKAGDVQREQAQDRVEELLDRSRKSTEGLVGIVRREIAHQLSSMGFATKADMDDLETRVDGRLAAMGRAPGDAPAKPPTASAGATGATAGSTGAARKAKTPSDTRVERAPATPPPGSAARKASAKGAASPVTTPAARPTKGGGGKRPASGSEA